MNPYKIFGPRAIWREAVSNHGWEDIFSGESGRFEIGMESRISSIGSCFARRVFAWLTSLGMNCGTFESPHPLLSKKEAIELGYCVGSARFGDVFSSAELLRVLTDCFSPRCRTDFILQNSDRRWVDLLRPNVVTGGFSSFEECLADREFHMICARDLFLKSNILIITLGLTECWESAGTTLGTHPAVVLGRAVGSVQSRRLRFSENMMHLRHFLLFLRDINPGLRFIFTVSPVGLMATHSGEHVLMANSYSKSTLRACIGELLADFEFVDYFFSYELIALVQTKGRYLTNDGRGVNDAGLALVRDVFGKMYIKNSAARIFPEPPKTFAQDNWSSHEIEDECDRLIKKALNRE